jgi:O-antigen/teichoic acid export membrane protein
MFWTTIHIVDIMLWIIIAASVFYVLFFAFVSILVCLCASALIYLWFDKYIDSIKFLPILCMSGFFRSVYYLFVNFLFYYKKTQYLMIITFGSSILHTLLSMILTRYSLYCTALITLFIDVIITMLVFLYSRKLYKLF